MLTIYYRLGALLLRLRYIAWLILIAAVALGAWSLLMGETEAGRGSDRYVLLALVLMAWMILSLTIAYHSQHPLAKAAPEAGLIQRGIAKSKRGITYCLILIMLFCAATLVWFSSSTARLFLAHGF